MSQTKMVQVKELTKEQKEQVQCVHKERHAKGRESGLSVGLREGHQNGHKDGLARGLEKGIGQGRRLEIARCCVVMEAARWVGLTEHARWTQLSFMQRLRYLINPNYVG